MRPTPAVHCKHAEKIERRVVQKNNDDPKENIIILKDTKYTGTEIYIGALDQRD